MNKVVAKRLGSILTKLLKLNRFESVANRIDSRAEPYIYKPNRKEFSSTNLSRLAAAVIMELQADFIDAR
ncbi:unnamed protein product [Sphenostylis stenocarpa]|uniref:Uncharacterized protein n=1 Tax=Sphenostylis stenocarpa TaxID=92480 RepID=A0AA86SYN2_9FABA|nr:unnamed protein product [Sphenostylis stenocarpa]